ncbi:DUF6702 family protein [uncultured Polaribacter sp.]|uniref:DUF6702 family protein n=1 Tax=uncultured Polaribacter sp. TaxID=174711 RepID=UPI00260E3A81|nr:DUF6702 family protein [uncultured Polaribacter sp.]
MKILICTFLFLLNISNKNNTHDAISATFNVIKKGHVLMLEIDFDEENFIKFGESSSLRVSKEDFRNYLYKTTNWEIDGEILNPKVLTLKSTEQHTRVICFLSKKAKNIKSIKVKNEFLLNIDSHSNIIKLDINDTFKDFRLHKDRREIVVNY